MTLPIVSETPLVIDMTKNPMQEILGRVKNLTPMASQGGGGVSTKAVETLKDEFVRVQTAQTQVLTRIADSLDKNPANNGGGHIITRNEGKIAQAIESVKSFAKNHKVGAALVAVGVVLGGVAIFNFVKNNKKQNVNAAQGRMIPVAQDTFNTQAVPVAQASVPKTTLPMF